MVATHPHITHNFALLYINSGDVLAMDNYGGLFDFDDSLSEWAESEYKDSDDDSGPDAVAPSDSGESAPPSPELAPVLEPSPAAPLEKKRSNTVGARVVARTKFDERSPPDFVAITGKTGVSKSECYKLRSQGYITWLAVR